MLTLVDKSKTRSITFTRCLTVLEPSLSVVKELRKDERLVFKVSILR